jgi:hypothetical protein
VTYYVVIAFDRGAEGDLKPGEAAASFPRRRSLIKDFASDSTNGKLSRQIGQYDASRSEQTHAASPRHFLTAALSSVPAHLDRKPNIEIKHAPKADKANA